MKRKKNEVAIPALPLPDAARQILDLIAATEAAGVAFPIIPELDQILRDYATEVMRVVVTREITHPLEKARAKILKWVAKILTEEANRHGEQTDRRQLHRGK
jgi:hypothetical protein